MEFKIVSNKSGHSLPIDSVVVACAPYNSEEAAHAWFYYQQVMVMTEDCLADWVRFDELRVLIRK